MADESEEEQLDKYQAHIKSSDDSKEQDINALCAIHVRRLLDASSRQVSYLVGYQSQAIQQNAMHEAIRFSELIAKSIQETRWFIENIQKMEISK